MSRAVSPCSSRAPLASSALLLGASLALGLPAFPGVALAGEPVVVDEGQRAEDFHPDDATPADGARPGGGGQRPDGSEGDRGKKRRGDGDGDGDEEVERDDRARFRGGIFGVGGAIIIPTESYSGDASTVALGTFGVQGQIGAQITNLVGLYVVPGIDVLFGSVGGVGASAALLVDFTIEDMVSIGAGPDVGAFAAFGVTINASGSSSSFAGGANVGGRLHLAVHPVVGIGENGIRRKAFTIALDTRLLGGFGVADSCLGTDCTNTDGGVTNFVFAPTLSLGYTAF